MSNTTYYGYRNYKDIIEFVKVGHNATKVNALIGFLSNHIPERDHAMFISLLYILYKLDIYNMGDV